MYKCVNITYVYMHLLDIFVWIRYFYQSSPTLPTSLHKAKICSIKDSRHFSSNTSGAGFLKDCYRLAGLKPTETLLKLDLIHNKLEC